MIKIAPSILNADFGHLADAIHEAEAGGADWIHVDVMDGMFVPNLTLGPMVVEAIRRATKLPLDIHLMIDEPRRYLPRFRDAGGDWLTIHLEADRHPHSTLPDIRSLVAQAAYEAAMLGARGNSGVILSQLLRGFAEALADAEELSPAALAAALSQASEMAYRSVSRPVEGTILTVAREVAVAARAAAGSS